MCHRHFRPSGAKGDLEGGTGGDLTVPMSTTTDAAAHPAAALVLEGTAKVAGTARIEIQVTYL
jgi:hypothetical protein